MCAKIDNFTNCYNVQKTLRFKLIPVGDTLKNFETANLLAEDEDRAEKYTLVKEYIDRYHRYFIKGILSSIKEIKGLYEYAELYSFSKRTDEDKKRMTELEAEMRNIIADSFQIKDKGKNKEKLFGNKLIKEVLPDFLTDEEEKETVEMFSSFTTYFSGFYENRMNIYSEEDKSTGIAYRCINDNLPKFLDNVKSFEKIKEALVDKIAILNEDFDGIYGTNVEDMFTVDYFPFALSQDEITRYNNIIGGYSNSDKTKVQGLNEYINQYNQKHSKSERLPLLKILYKQILSESTSISFIPEKFKSDNELLISLKHFFDGVDYENNSILDVLSDINILFNNLEEYDLKGIFVKIGKEITDVSNGAFGHYGAIKSGWEDEYASKVKFNGKNLEKYEDTRNKFFKNSGSISLAKIQLYGQSKAIDEKTNAKVTEWLKQEISNKTNALVDSYNLLKPKLSEEYNDDKKLSSNEDYIVPIKNCLDAIKNFESSLKLVLGTSKESNKDDAFYGEFLPLYSRICEVDKLYDKVRNYMTQKPYSDDKIKLNFNNPQFLGGWDKNKESDCSAVILRDNDIFYIAVMDSKYRDVFKEIPYCDDSNCCYQKVVYKQIPNAAKYLSSKQISPQNPPDDIKKILEKKKEDPKSLSKAEIERFIDYSINDFLKNYNKLIDENGDNYFNFEFKNASEYEGLKEFFDHVDEQAYSIKFRNVPKTYIDELVSSGKIYLFQLYNKDFSQYSNGTPNLHTIYFKELFDEVNLKKGTIVLNGGAEMFYRKKSINDGKITHPKNQPIKNKNEDNLKKESTFNYDLIKDKRYTFDQFTLHFSITLNKNAKGINSKDFNKNVRQALKQCTDNYVIGIDRGERNLIYISVINGNGEIVEQISLNEIINEYNGNTYKTDYHKLLDKKEKDRLDARKNWTTIEGIKELKEGYISQVVHKICLLVEKYDAIIAMEDLNSGFKNTRSAVEKSVYQKFEKMLIDKLNFYVNKKKQPDEMGGVLNAYQLTNKFESFKKMGTQNGIIFYIPAWNTSKIDPTTGFIDLLKPKYESVESSIKFFDLFDSVSYNAKEDYFEFSFNYDNFPKGVMDFKKKWTVCTYGERIETFRNKEKNSEWDNKVINLTSEFKDFFIKWDIDIHSDIKSQILKHDEKEFFTCLIRLLKLTLQMRNSITNDSEDYLISPVKNASGDFYCSKDYEKIENTKWPKDADANGAYNIARKAQWAINKICSTDEDDLGKVKINITNKEWLEYAQKA